ncbi:MAG: hypothetical protein GX233_03520 [Erysipelothrix sp.]|nr:hypothetical protein [Erysipelothrix sp.]
MEKHSLKASIMAFVVYPVIGVLFVVLNLFQSKSIQFCGFNLLLEEGETYARASLSFEWYFILTFLCVFVVTWVLDYGYKQLTINSHRK